MKRIKDGVTLLELLAVVIILGIISTIAIIGIGRLLEKTRENADYASLEVLNEVTRNYFILETIETDDIFQDITTDEERLEKLIEQGYLESSVSTQVDDTSFIWNVEKQQWEYVDINEKIIIILESKYISAATQQIYLSFEIYIDSWLEENETMPVFNQNNASLSWSSANYTGTSQTNIYAADFWNGYFEFADTDGFDASNSDISDFKIFFKRDINGVVTSKLVAVYLQMGGDRSIYFDNNVTITQTHYSAYLDTVTKQIIPPEA
jgi:prepilin-type N-terminal cleavage/methylation domain-containing protein